ncbi:MAG: hypothetical protein AAFY81_06825, partial [Pseudomonadota bacterium]
LSIRLVPLRTDQLLSSTIFYTVGLAFDNLKGASEGGIFENLRLLLRASQLLLAASILASVFTAISTLAKPVRSDLTEEGICEMHNMQVDTLNRTLYISAGLMVSLLLFHSAYHLWPAIGLVGEERKIFEANARAIVVYYAVCYSMLMAAFYLPAAAILGSRLDFARIDKSEETTEQPYPVSQLLKVVLSIFAPLVTALVGGSLNFSALAGG